MFSHNTMGHITKMSKEELNQYILELSSSSHDTKKKLDEKRNDLMYNLKSGLV